jgi:hypothetical protein
MAVFGKLLKGVKVRTKRCNGGYAHWTVAAMFVVTKS